MKKIVLISTVFIMLFSCSKSTTDELTPTNTTIPTNLIGSWKYTGYYDDNGLNNSFFHLYPDSFLINFKSDGTFPTDYNGTYSNGTYTVTNDVLACNYNPNTAPISLSSLKMYVFTSTVLEVYTYPLIGTDITHRFEKVTLKN